MKKLLPLLLLTVLWMSSCTVQGNYPYGDYLGRYHYGKGNHYSGKYHGSKYRYNWERHR